MSAWIRMVSDEEADGDLKELLDDQRAKLRQPDD